MKAQEEESIRVRYVNSHLFEVQKKAMIEHWLSSYLIQHHLENDSPLTASLYSPYTVLGYKRGGFSF